MKLIIFHGRRKIGSEPLSSGEMIVGRHVDSDVHLDDKTVSRRHARIRWDGEQVHIEDLASSSGITINQNPATRARVLAGDRIEIGPFTLVLASDELGIGTSLDIDTVRGLMPPRSNVEEETVSLGPQELEARRGRQRTLLGPHLVLRSPQGNSEFPMSGTTQTIGFSDDCEIRLPGFAFLNKRLGDIAPDGKGWAVVATSRLVPVSVNGTRVDRKHLEDGDMIEFKGLKLKFLAAVGNA